MKREFVEKLLKENGIAKEKVKELVDKVMDENGKDIETEKAKTTVKETELATANTTIKGLQDDIKKFDGVDVETLKTKAADWETKYNTDVAAERTKAENLKREFTLKDTLRESGVLDPDYLIFKHGGIEKFAFNDEGKIIGLEETIKPYKESNPTLFKQDDSNGASVTVNSGGEHGKGGNQEPTTLRGALADVYK